MLFKQRSDISKAIQAFRVITLNCSSNINLNSVSEASSLKSASALHSKSPDAISLLPLTSFQAACNFGSAEPNGFCCLCFCIFVPYIFQPLQQWYEQVWMHKIVRVTKKYQVMAAIRDKHSEYPCCWEKLLWQHQ
jgi:hypothetical protein